MKKEKLRLVLWLCLSMVVVSGLYMALVAIRFVYVTPLYMAASVILAVFYVIIAFRNAKMKLILGEQGREPTGDEAFIINRNERHLKILLILFLPVLITLLCDYVYISYLSDLSWLKSISEKS